nr:type VII secretion-associated serine protease mycosin [Micromonospora pattaloongensis]
MVPAVPATATPPPDVTVPLRADPVRDDQWQLRELHATAAWRHAKGDGVTVAVLDSGVDATHADLVGQVLPGMDFVKPGNGQFDPVGHGTTVAGLIAGRDDDDRGAVGLAPHAKILPVRVLDEENRYDDSLVIAKAVRWAVDNGARVINMSLGGHGRSPALAAALDYAFARDVVVIACTGNVTPSAPTDVWYPAREPGVVAVAGMEKEAPELWSGSITGRETVITAPGNGLVGARPGGHWRVQGTSFAAPLVAATAALIRSRWPEMSAADVVNRLIRTASDVGPPGRDDRFGFGVVDPVAALTRPVPTVEHNPLDDQTSPGVVGFGRAPGLEQPGTTTAPLGQLGNRATGEHASWVARAAGSGDIPRPPGLLVAAVFVAMLVTGTLFTRHRLLRREQLADRRRELTLQRVLSRRQETVRRRELTLRRVMRRQQPDTTRRWRRLR